MINMAKKDYFNIAHVIGSWIVLICGIVLSILTQEIAKTVFDVVGRKFSSNLRPNQPYWVIGLIFIVPGFFGLLASFLQKNKGLFITQIVLSVISLAILIAAFVYGLRGPTTRSFLDSRTCDMLNGVCSCSTRYLQSLRTLGFSCDEIAKVTGMGVGTDVITLLGALFTFICVILAGKYDCCEKDQQNQTTGSLQMSGIQGSPPMAGYTAQPGYTNPGYPVQPGYANPVYLVQQGYADPGYPVQQGYANPGYTPPPGYETRGVSKADPGHPCK